MTAAVGSSAAAATYEVGVGDVRVLVDVYEPAEVRGTVVYLHGGAWIMGSRRDHASRLEALAARGLRVASLDYRLAQRGAYPAQQRDVEHVIGWLRESGLVEGAHQVVLMGASAGAHLAALIGLAGPFRPAGIVGLFGRYDLTDAAGALPAPSGQVPAEIRTAQPPAGLEGHTPALRCALLAGVPTPELSAEHLARLSPVTYLAPDSPPMLVLHGQNDAVTHFGHALHLADVARARGASCEVMLVPDANHEDERFEEPPYTARIAAFVAETIAATSASSVTRR